MINCKEFIDELGCTGEVAAILGTNSNTVSNWKKRGIPWQKRKAVEILAKKRRVKLPDDFWQEGE